MKILLIALSGIGDTLIATPLIRELRANFPDAQVEVLVMHAAARELLEGNPHINRVHQKSVFKDGPLKMLPFLWKLRSNGYDLSLNAHTQGRPGYRAIAALIGARQRVGHIYENSGWLDRTWFMQAMVAEDYTVHSIENNNRLLPLIGAKPMLGAHKMELLLTPAEEQFARDFIATNRLEPRRILGIHVGSGATKNLALKRWPLAN